MSIAGFFKELRLAAFETGLIDYKCLKEARVKRSDLFGLERNQLQNPDLNKLYSLASLYADALGLPRKAVRDAVYKTYQEEFCPSYSGV
mgnify:CR=1 FL=1